ncbi:cytochrome c biogenesis protein CcdA [Anaeromyxobacter sp. Fw109-5]|uniref:cytochrome c biogenesis protein CcdA n=1 Tax=Anaeromyxobacter sp. (strain Fw109-5) TaxID=404589 RepID=UPI0000ED6D2E|nr:cytochrome c biogenesis protein CcdA [Anaeromyxobacter sp. Fw109-5]ABS28303.1 cytochrome c biogenesis protein transmembrane region [Anaeromyxobacter sp. Fw109-5]
MSVDIPGLFAAGLLTFLSPCVLPLVPIYLGLLGGASASDVRAGSARGRLVATAGAFSLGLASVFVALGLGASAAGALLEAHRETLLRVAGVVVVAFGLKFLGLLRLPGLDRERRPLLARAAPGGSLLASFAFGGAFALGWTPCIGPVLGSVLTYTVSSGASAARGALYLATYAAGLVAPLLVAAAFAPRALRLLDRVKPHLRKVELATGALLVAVGALLATDRLMVLMPSMGGDAPLALAPGAPPPPAVPIDGDAAPCDASAPSSRECALPPIDAAPAEPAGALAAQLAASAGPRVVEVMSRSCPVCRSMEPVVAEAERGCPGAHVQRRLVEEPEGAELARRHGVRGVPTFLVLDGSGREVRRLVGAQSVEALAGALQLATGRLCDARSLERPATARGG